MNPLKAEAVVKLEDGRELTFAYDVNAWIDIGEELGRMNGGPDVELPEILDTMKNASEENPLSLKFQRVLVWGGLRKHHPEISVRDAGEIMVEAAPAMEKVMAGGMPEAEEEAPPADGDEGPTEASAPAKAGRGAVSTSAGLASV